MGSCPLPVEEVAAHRPTLKQAFLALAVLLLTTTPTPAQICGTSGGTVLGRPPGGASVVAAAAGVLVAVADGALSPAPTVQWVHVRGTAAGVARDLVWSGTRFVAVGDSLILARLDGFAWSQAAAPSANLETVTWNDGTYVAVGSTDDFAPPCCQPVAYTSSDGEQSSTSIIAADAEIVLTDVVWNGQRFVAVGTRVFSLKPFEYRRENGVITSVTTNDVPEAYATISVSTPGATVLAYASVVDSRSGDPIYVPAR